LPKLRTANTKSRNQRFSTEKPYKLEEYVGIFFKYYFVQKKNQEEIG
jgi:hypothetical protein